MADFGVQGRSGSQHASSSSTSTSRRHPVRLPVPRPRVQLHARRVRPQDPQVRTDPGRVLRALDGQQPVGHPVQPRRLRQPAVDRRLRSTSGPSNSSTAQTGTYADGDYEMVFDNLNKTDIGYIFMSAMNGWRGIKVSGSTSDLGFFGGTYEGFKRHTSQSRAPGHRRIRSARRRHRHVPRHPHRPGDGRARRRPRAATSTSPAANGTSIGPHFYRGDTADTVPAIFQTGGRLMVMGATRRQSETWAPRPRIETIRPVRRLGEHRQLLDVLP